MLGSGTIGDPYIIQDVTDLQNVELDLTAYYELEGDIDAFGVAFTPLGTFTGTLDGKGYEIQNLAITINTTGNQEGALFRQNNGTIQNVKIIDCVYSITSTDKSARGAALVYGNYGTITNCFASGTIDCVGKASYNAYSMAGGLVGWNNTGALISNSGADVAVTVSGNDAEAAGFIFDNYGKIETCYALGDAIAHGFDKSWAAGFICQNDDGGTIDDAYARGNATATHDTNTSYAGGFVAQNFGVEANVITNAYSTGIATAGTLAGGFCAVDDGTITNSFWDKETSGTAVSDGGTGKTTAQMKTKATFSGWDIAYTSTYRNDGYPFLSWELGSSPTWLIYTAAGNGNGNGDGDEEPEPEPEPEPTPGVVKPSVMTLPATGVS